MGVTVLAQVLGIAANPLRGCFNQHALFTGICQFSQDLVMAMLHWRREGGGGGSCEFITLFLRFQCCVPPAEADFLALDSNDVCRGP